MAQAYNLLGLLATDAGDNAAAVAHLQNSLDYAVQIDDLGARIAATNNLALAHRASGELAEALRLTRAALDGCERLGDRHREAALHNNLADLLHVRRAGGGDGTPQARGIDLRDGQCGRGAAARGLEAGPVVIEVSLAN